MRRFLVIVIGYAMSASAAFADSSPYTVGQIGRLAILQDDAKPAGVVSVLFGRSLIDGNRINVNGEMELFSTVNGGDFAIGNEVGTYSMKSAGLYAVTRYQFNLNWYAKAKAGAVYNETHRSVDHDTGTLVQHIESTGRGFSAGGGIGAGFVFFVGKGTKTKPRQPVMLEYQIVGVDRNAVLQTIGVNYAF